ncbi:MAG: bifunctional proline dehydrogenase/L-glutamate gamma-semialdehyde dehydrogenase [Actinomycetaceae bacterium]|nr:bifunctional proline dehydrogenase/L-glutamate gamma-semialdehyde dehydrogenase [Arcanobacterium sp.]MDD7686338.1 bifunctional proline dehydrogenase/L-glutamate gamma-semialdehyde dehydrogenase [Actinomycetaceae bacterium]MDY5274197.1 bifunctional proline dehydrogenase/L-glutamate gamma-semialdehyde dehydrogenase [Arcanobacterium sp.]
MAEHDIDYAHIGELATRRARTWLERSKKYPTDRAAQLLAQTLKDPHGLDFTVSFVDGVIRPEDPAVAAHALAKLSASKPSFLPSYLSTPLSLGGKFAQKMPHIVVPAATKVFQQLVGDLVLDAKGKGLTAAIARLHAQGARLNMNLLGEAVLGDKEAAKRMADTITLLERDDVDYVSMKVSAVIGPHNPFAYDEAVRSAVESLLPLYEKANSYEPKKFVNLDMEEYHDLHLTIDVFTSILDRPEFKNLRAGIVIQAYLPDALPAMQHLQEWAAARVAAGGAPIKVRVVKGANLSMERVEAQIHGWELVTQPSKECTDANYIRVLDYALTKERTENVTIGVAGMNLFTAGFAFELAQERGILGTDRVEFEMLAGMAAPQAQAMREDVGHLLFYVPVVNPEEYDVAIAYLVRRLEENALPANFMSSIFDIAHDETLLMREQNRFLSALSHAFSDPIGPRRQQDRRNETEDDIASFVTDDHGEWIFNNTPDTDPSLPANLKWARAIAQKMQHSTLGNDAIARAHISTSDALDAILTSAYEGGQKWGALSGAQRADILHRAGVALSAHRAELMEVAGSEAGKTVDQGDVEVSEAVDFAHYYAEQAKALDVLTGARYDHGGVIVVTPPWNFPISIPAGGVLAALASGAGVVFKPAPQARRTGAVLAQVLWEAGVPREALHLVDVPEGELGKELITHRLVDRVILTGSIDTAQLFKGWKPELDVLAETSGKDSIIVTPHADLDLAVKDVVTSAFGHAGQKCSAASLVILVGSVARSKRFHDQLLDAAASLKVGWPWDLSTQMGPIVEPAAGKLLQGLTELDAGERWALQPRQLDASGKLWSPGIRSGVQPGSRFHLTEYFGPILGIMSAQTLEEAIEIQNAPQFGLTAGLHSLDPDEITYWLEHVQAGNVYVNRGITGAIVRRQPFGGWKHSAVGAGTKAGGPSYLFGLVNFKRDESVLTSDMACADLSAPALVAAEQITHSLTADDAQRAHALLASMQEAIDTEYGVGHDPSGLGVERNVLRYRPLPVTIRLSEGEDAWQLLALAAGGMALGSRVNISAPRDLDSSVRRFLTTRGISLLLHSDAEFYTWIGQWARRAGFDGRVRLIGGSERALAAAVPPQFVADVAVWDGEVTLNGRVELLPFVHEQAVSFTNHRFGNATPLSREVEIS